MPDTSYHGWTYPTVDASEDEWGEILNALFGDQDLDVIAKGETTGTPPTPTEPAGTEGRWYLGTDTTDPRSNQSGLLPYLFYDDGTSWITIWDGDAKTLAGNDASTFLTTNDTIDADTLDGNEPSAFASASHSHAKGDLPSATAFTDDQTNFTAGLQSGGEDVLTGSVIADSTVQLSSGSAVISTGQASGVDVELDPSNGGANASDVKVVARAFWDASAGEVKVEIIEDGTNVGNPTVGYTIRT